MILSTIAHIFSALLELIRISRMSDHDKDLEILVLRYQLGIADRKLNRTLKPDKSEKLALAVLVTRIKQRTNRTTNDLRSSVRIFTPRTVIRWHNELVKRKWTYKKKNQGGRPRINKQIEKLIVRLAEENGRWGYGKITGELIKLGLIFSESTIRNVLNRNGILPAPVRFGSLGWRHLMNHYKSQILACDFLTVETLFLKTVYIFFFIDLKTRRVYLAGVTSHPDGFWVAQQARQFTWELHEHETLFRHRIHDRDSKFTKVFDNVFQSEDINIIRTPVKAPNAYAFAERFVRSLREEILDHVLIINETHLLNVLNEYLAYYNERRPHQGLDQQSPIPRPSCQAEGKIIRQKVLGGIINDYQRLLPPALT
jgi:transposase InsO family protein